MSEKLPIGEMFDADLFLQYHRETLIFNPTTIEAALQVLPPEHKKEVLDAFLNNFYFNLPGGAYRKHASEKKQALFAAIDAALKAHGLLKQPAERLVKTITDTQMDGGELLRADLHNNLLPIYVELREQGLSHEELTA